MAIHRRRQGASQRGHGRASSATAAAAVSAAAVLLGSADGAVVDSSLRRGTAAITPELYPKSDKVFNKVDFPHDMSPKPLHEFSHPFPIVQDSEDYDKDFVSDKNSDGGEWKVSEAYNKLRGKMEHARAMMEAKRAREAMTSKQLRALQAEEKEARERAEAALKKKLAAEKRAREKHEAAEEHYNKTMGITVSNDPVRNATEVVDVEIRDLEKCKKELAAARKRLQDLQLERLDAEAKAKADMRKEDELEDVAMDKDKAEATAEDEVESDLKQYKDAQSKRQKAEEEYRQMQVNFVKAEAQLRTFRQKVDPEGGVYRSRGLRAAAAATTLLPMLAGLLALLR